MQADQQPVVFTASPGYVRDTRELLASLRGLTVTEKRRSLLWVEFTITGEPRDLQRARNRLLEITEDEDDMRTW